MEVVLYVALGSKKIEIKPDKRKWADPKGQARSSERYAKALESF